MRQPLIVLKFGGSVLTDEPSLRIAVHEIYRWRREGWRVVAVVSALAGRTEALLARCESLCDRASALARAPLIATGEIESAALLGLHLDRAGLPASVLLPHALGLLAGGDPLEATPRTIDRAIIDRALDRDGVVVCPGFIARDKPGRTVTLGRGGSDLTALFLAHALKATRCRLIKDVDGLYTSDPARPGPRPARYASATYDDALTTDGSIIQHRAVRFAQDAGLTLELGRFNGTRPTRIGPSRSVLESAPDAPRRLKIAVVGLGTVGGGVLQLATQLPGHFELVGAAVRNRANHPEIDPTLLHTDPRSLAECGADIVVEALGGIEPARSAIGTALRAGSHVVTANKAVLAEHGEELHDLAARCGRSILFSAAVGGSLPLIERSAAAPVRSIRAVLNGTANFVLESLRAGRSLPVAIEEAQHLGLAEADPARDLDGRDSLDKLRILANVLDLPGSIPADNSQASLTETSTRALPPDTRLRQIATLSPAGLAVRLEPLHPGDPLFDLTGELNAAIIERTDGATELLRGRGAGRWPTSESVLADLLELGRAASSRPSEHPQSTDAPAHTATEVQNREPLHA